jgi:hypothetical protein
MEELGFDSHEKYVPRIGDDSRLYEEEKLEEFDR